MPTITTITKKELIDRIASASKHKRMVVKDVVKEFLNQVIVELGKGNRLELRDFGVFETKKRAARTAQNPKTLQRVEVPAKRTVKFKVGRLMKESLEDPERVMALIAAGGGAGHDDNGHDEDVRPAASAASRNGRVKHASR
jgi:integration host factor subunit beta